MASKILAIPCILAKFAKSFSHQNFPLLRYSILHYNELQLVHIILFEEPITNHGRLCSPIHTTVEPGPQEPPCQSSHVAIDHNGVWFK